MQSDSIQRDVKDLATKLASLDPLLARAAINQYFDANATLDSSTLRLHGATRIKKQLDLLNHAFAESNVIGEPKLDDQSQTVTFTFQRILQAPHIPYIASIPFVSRLSSARRVVNYDFVLHLNTEGTSQKDEEKEILVTKVDIERREKIPFENAVPWRILRPVISPAANIVASLASIIFAHPATPRGILGMTSQGINEFVGYIFSILATEKEKRLPTGQSWSEHADANLPPAATKALNNAIEMGKNLESRAKASGIPVDEHRHLAYNTAENLVTEGLSLVQGKKDQAQTLVRGMSGDVADYTTQKKGELEEFLGRETREAGKVAKEAKAIAGEMADSTSQKKGEVEGYVAEKGKEGLGLVYAGKTKLEVEAEQGVEHVQEREDKRGEVDSAVKQDSITRSDLDATHVLGFRKGYRNDVPRTPMGGHDPLAPNAFSFADAVLENSDNTLSSGGGGPASGNGSGRGDGDGDGYMDHDAGHANGNGVVGAGDNNPLAPGPISYAEAVLE